MKGELSFLGLGKTKFFSSVCYIPDGDRKQMQVWQTERLTRKKNSGAWPHVALRAFVNSIKALPENLIIAENRDVETPMFFENFLNKEFPFFDFLKKNNLEKFSSHFNSELSFVTHHEAHAYAALLMSPFEKSIIVVMDGAGSRAKDFKEEIEGVESDRLEECSVYLQDGANLKNVSKRWIRHDRDGQNKIVSDGTGHLYETCSEFIFHDANSSGKVMGLAPFGRGQRIKSRESFIKNLDWNFAYQGRGKKDWEESPDLELYKDLAATMQLEFEKDYREIIAQIRIQFPEYRHLILTGGCALNCTNNALIYYQNIFEKIYVLPFPGDDGIAVGCAAKELYTRFPEKWEPLEINEQRSCWGPMSSVPDQQKLEALLKEKNISYEICKDVTKTAASDLIDGLVIGWFQGRSESGPRALGHRSILARPDLAGIKNFLNEYIKMRENFRPYGCSVIKEKASTYFEVDQEFDNLFMSFAVRTRENYQEVLKEVCHVDKTSRMQTIRKCQDEQFYRLIQAFGDVTGLYCLLNTSLNIMGEPIVETIEDAVRFFETTPVETMFIGHIKLKRK